MVVVKAGNLSMTFMMDSKALSKQISNLSNQHLPSP
jgi:hypothetical protein